MLFALVALLAMALNVFVPVAMQLAKLGANGKVYPVAELCSVAKSGQPAGKTGPLHGMAACDYCTMQHCQPALPAMAAAVPPALSATGYPPLFYHAPTRLPAWRHAAPRGPPATA